MYDQEDLFLLIIGLMGARKYFWYRARTNLPTALFNSTEMNVKVTNNSNTDKTKMHKQTENHRIKRKL